MEEEILELTDVELRVLGALVEKSIATPDNYPLTLNSLRTACNQKSSRNPVVEYDEETVVLGLNGLNKRHLIGTEKGGYGRTVKYEHHFKRELELDNCQAAVLCLLILRGPLTPGEIKSNSGRLFTFGEISEVHQCLQQLSQRETPLIQMMSRKPGQKEARVMHLLGGEIVEDEGEMPVEPARKSVGELEGRVEQLEQEVAELKEKLERLYKELMS